MIDSHDMTRIEGEVEWEEVEEDEVLEKERDRQWQ